VATDQLQRDATAATPLLRLRCKLLLGGTSFSIGAHLRRLNRTHGFRFKPEFEQVRGCELF
jgi:hypothetical protein